MTKNLVTIGFSSDASNVRQNEDYYATEPKALEVWPALDRFKNVWEPAVGGGHLANVLQAKGQLKRVSDIIDRGYPGTETIDFTHFDGKWDGDIITNPPFKMATDFIKKALEVTKQGAKIAMFLPIRYLEGVNRYKLLKDFPPTEIWVSVKRLACAKNGDPDLFAKGSATAYAWFIWENGKFDQAPQIYWFNDK